MLGCAGLCWAVLGCAGLCLAVLECVRIGSILDCVRLCSIGLFVPRMFLEAPRWALVNLHKGTRKVLLGLTRRHEQLGVARCPGLGLCCAGLDWFELGCAELGCAGLGWPGLVPFFSPLCISVLDKGLLGVRLGSGVGLGFG